MRFLFLDLPIGGLLVALATSLILGICCAVVGSFIVVRRTSMMGDVISHSILPGVAVAFLFYDRSPFFVFAFALLASLMSIFLVYCLVLTTRLKQDAVLGIALATFFSLGIVLISKNQISGAQSFLYGQISVISQSDLQILLGISFFCLFSLLLLWRPLYVSGFDSDFAHCLRYPYSLLEGGFFVLVSILAVVAVQAVGVILVSALLIIPVTISSLLTRRFHSICFLSVLFGGFSAILGCFLSFSQVDAPTGPMIVLVLAFNFLLAALFFSKRGVLRRILAFYAKKKKIKQEDCLKFIYEFNENHTCSIQDFFEAKFSNWLLKGLSKRKEVILSSERISLTKKGGRRAISLLRKHLLWEKYLNQKVGCLPDHVHDDAEIVEHLLKKEDVQDLIAELGNLEEDFQEE